MCARCGKALCSACAEDVGGALLCSQCIALLREEEAVRQEQEFVEVEARRRLDVRHVKKIILWSWIITVVLGTILVVALWKEREEVLSVADKFFMAILWIYIIWSWYWGFIFVANSRWGRKIFGREISGCLMIILWLFVAPCAGFFGGGIYKYLQYRKIVKEGE